MSQQFQCLPISPADQSEVSDTFIAVDGRRYPFVEIGGRRYVRPEILAAIFDVSSRTVSRWEARRQGPPRISLGNMVLYDLQKIPAWLESRESSPIRAGGPRR